MIAPLEEIRIARDAMDLIMTLISKHPGMLWAVQAVEFKDKAWRVVTVVHSALGLMRFEDSFSAAVSPMQIYSRVNEILSKF